MIQIEIKQSIEDQSDILDLLVKQYSISKKDIRSFTITHRSLDIRKGHTPCYLYQIATDLANEERYLKRLKAKARHIEPYIYRLPQPGTKPLAYRPVVIGAGPAGLAAAYFLAKANYQPILLERGPDTDARQAAVDAYWKTGVLDTEKNVQFGEGGAGAFSDGKLTTRIKDPRVPMILNELIQAGADPSIAWLNHPHVGTDHFKIINKNLRNTILSLGGEVHFNTRVDRFTVSNHQIHSVITNTGKEIPCNVVILAIGHSARDTFQVLYDTNLNLQSKPFAIGMRVEHLQSFINANQYKALSDYHTLPPAEYHLAHTSSVKKGTYSFCMCPGGYVVAGASMKDTVVTNGMSYHDRGGKNANSAIVAQVFPNIDFGGELFDGMHYQETLERKAYALGKQKAPAELLEHYLNPAVSNTIKEVKPTYPLGVQLTDLHELFNDSLNTSFEEFFHYSETVIPGFTTNGALLTGIETRTSSPVRIVRDPHTLQSNIHGIYPAGEGAGYAGGIVSAMIDGLKCAEEIIKEYQSFISFT